MIKIQIILLIAVLASCVGNERSDPGIAVSGKVNYPAVGEIFLEKFTPEGYEVVDSARLDSEQKFLLHIQKKGTGIYRINFFNKKDFVFPVKEDDVFIDVDNATFTATGSEGIEAVSEALKLQNVFNLSSSVLREQMQTAYSLKDSAEFLSLRKQYNDREVTLKNKLKELIRGQSGNLSSVLMLFRFFPIEQNLDFYDEQIPLAEKQLSNSDFFQKVKNSYQSVKRTAIGSVAPEISLPAPDGRVVSLSDFRGEYVFLDFWASWCTPCRMENPELVGVYNHFKDSGFEIFGVSFDKKKENWLKAIKEDGLDWPQVSDLKYFDSELLPMYNIESIPVTYLLDPEGKIIAKNLHADELERQLENLLH